MGDITDYEHEKTDEDIVTDAELRRAADDALIAGLDDNLKRSITAALDRGMRPSALLARLRATTGGAHSPRGGLTYMACEALIERHVAALDGTARDAEAADIGDHHPNCENPDRMTPRSLCPHCGPLA